MRTNAIRRPSRRTNSTASKIVSAGLATATCIGLVGVIGVRTAQESAAAAADAATQTVDNSDVTLASATTTDGLSQAELDAYAAQLDAEAQRLADYRTQLVDAALQLQQAAGGQSRVTVNKPAAVPSKAQASQPTKPKVKVSKPAAQAAPKPAPKPQTTTKSS